MPKQRGTNVNFRDRLDYLTDREEILKLFKRFLRSSEGNSLLLTIRGNSGSGKTFLISYLANRICP
jgi:hypothetical protein